MGVRTHAELILHTLFFLCVCGRKRRAHANPLFLSLFFLVAFFTVTFFILLFRVGWLPRSPHRCNGTASSVHANESLSVLALPSRHPACAALALSTALWTSSRPRPSSSWEAQRTGRCFALSRSTTPSRCFPSRVCRSSTTTSRHAPRSAFLPLSSAALKCQLWCHPEHPTRQRNLCHHHCHHHHHERAHPLHGVSHANEVYTTTTTTTITMSERILSTV
jgi:hypothetical protein